MAPYRPRPRTSFLVTAFYRCVFVGSLIMVATLSAGAQTPAPGAQTQAELTAANQIAAARYGAAVTPPEGKVDNVDKLLPIVLALQPDAYDTIAETVAASIEAVRSKKEEKASQEINSSKTKDASKDADPSKAAGASNGKSVLITTRTNTGVLILSARQVRQDIERIREEGQAIVNAKPAKTLFGGPLTVPAILSMAGGIDALVGLFRTNYNFAGGDAEANKLGLQLAVHRALQSKGIDATIDELDIAPADASGFNSLLNELAQLRQKVADKNPAANSREANFVAAADKVLAALQTPGTDGATPAAKMVALLSLDTRAGEILYLSPLKVTASAVTTKKLFSRNSKVHLMLTGLINVAYQSAKGDLLYSATLTLGKKATLNLRKLEDESAADLVLRTSGEK